MFKPFKFPPRVKMSLAPDSHNRSPGDVVWLSSIDTTNLLPDIIHPGLFDVCKDID